MKRADLKAGDEVVLTRHAETGRRNKAITGKVDGYWTATVIDPKATYPGWVNFDPYLRPNAQQWKDVPGVTVEITGYVPTKTEANRGVTERDYDPETVRNQLGGGTEVRDGKAMRILDPTRHNTPPKEYGVGEQVTITARLIVNTVEKNAAVIEARRQAHLRARIEEAEAKRQREALLARAEAVGLTLGKDRWGRTVIENPVTEVIEKIEALTEKVTA